MTVQTFSTAFRHISTVLDEIPSGAPKRKPVGADSVRVSDVSLLPELFAARSSGRNEDGGIDRHHLKELERTLLAMPEGSRFFDPIIVFDVAGKDYCVDGHHRVVAYRGLKVTGRVPVVRMSGTLADALAASINANAKARLPMTRQERHEAAWKLVRISHGTKAEQARWSGMSETFISDLRRLKKRLEGAASGVDWGSLWEAMRLDAGGTVSSEWTEEMEQAEVDEYAKRLLKAFGRKVHTRPVPVVAALASLIGSQGVADALNEIGDRFGEVLEGVDYEDDQEVEF